MNALTGSPSTVVRVSENGEEIVSVAVPIQRFRAVLGVLMLSTEGGDIDKIVAAERKAILRVFGVAALVMAILSMLLASTIANPLRRLSAAAVRVRRGVKSREEIPDFSDRQDEIGNLSVAVRGMTNALYARIEAIESFAADVAHELKNPLTSLRSAVETLPIARNEASRGRLMEIIQHDVRRLDRLITDISDASRLDAELARDDATRIDLKELVSDLVGLAQQAGRQKREGRHRVQGGQAAAGRQGLFRHRPRPAHRPGHHQPGRKRPLLRSRRPRSHFGQPGAGRKVQHHNGRGQRARASVPTRSTGSSSASTRIGPPARRSARIPDWDCRSAARSPRRMAAASLPRTFPAPSRVTSGARASS